jgi:hypothetical protein
VRAPLAAAVLLLVPFRAFAADPSQPKSMKASFIGEGGGYKPADQATESILVGDQGAPATNDRPARAGEIPAAAAHGAGIPAAGVSTPQTPRAAPQPPAGAAVPSVSASPRIDAPSRPSAARPAASGGNASIPEEAKQPAGRQSLWDGLVQPIAMSGSAAASATDDAARAEADRDYETHILGMKPAPNRAALADRSALETKPENSAAASDAAASAARADGGKVFVSLALDPREAGSLRDAVAGLGASAGFSADARFEAMPGPNGTVLYSGWLPADRLGAAMSRPGVKSVRVETRARPSNPR